MAGVLNTQGTRLAMIVYGNNIDLYITNDLHRSLFIKQMVLYTYNSNVPEPLPQHY